MKRHPSKRLILSLILAKEDIEETLDRYELPSAPKKYLDSLKKDLDSRAPENFRIDKDDKDSVDFAKELGIYNLLFPDKYTFEAYSLLGTLHIRADLEKFILSREDSAKISKLLTSKYKTPVTKDAIDRYIAYFWNVNEMKLDDWELVLADKKDKRESITILKAGPDYARHVLGFAQKCQIKQSLEDIANIMGNDLKLIKLMPESSEKAKTLSMYAQSLIKIDEKLNTVGSSIQDDIAVFERVRISHSKVDIAAIEELSSLGTFTSPQHSNMKQLAEDSVVIDID